MPLDAKEYNRRIGIINASHRNAREMLAPELLKLSEHLLKTLADTQAPKSYNYALFTCISKCRHAGKDYEKYNKLHVFRTTVLSELELLGREFISLRDTPPAQEWVSKGGFTLVSEGLTLEPPIPPAPHFQPGAKLTLEEASGLGEELTLEEASGLGIEAPKMPREKVQEEDWQRRYEETNTLLEKTQALLVKTKDDFTKRLESLERTLADEQKAVRIAQDEKEAAANTVKEDLGKKQWRIQELEGKVRTLTEAKLELEQKLAGLNMRITEAETAAKQAKSEQGKLQIELEEQRTPTKAREALENEVEAYSVRVAQVEAGYAEMQAHWTEMAQALKLRQGAEQAAQSVQSGAASCSTPLRRFLEKFVAEVRPNAPPQSPAV